MHLGATCRQRLKTALQLRLRMLQPFISGWAQALSLLAQVRQPLPANSLPRGTQHPCFAGAHPCPAPPTPLQPAAAPRTLQLYAELADSVWHAAGDVSTDSAW
jgi:ubiquinone biosynthesis protein COQ9